MGTSQSAVSANLNDHVCKNFAFICLNHCCAAQCWWGISSVPEDFLEKANSGFGRWEEKATSPFLKNRKDVVGTGERNLQKYCCFPGAYIAWKALCYGLNPLKEGLKIPFSSLNRTVTLCLVLLQCLIIGAGPCGLRTAIDLSFLGAKVVVIEKRDAFSRNNVLHLWPFTIHDLRGLGAKKFYGKFCAGSIDHISKYSCCLSWQHLLKRVRWLRHGASHENASCTCHSSCVSMVWYERNRLCHGMIEHVIYIF